MLYLYHNHGSETERGVVMNRDTFELNMFNFTYLLQRNQQKTDQC